MSLTPEEEAELAALEAEMASPEPAAKPSRVPYSKGKSALLGAGQGASLGLVDEIVPFAVKAMAAYDGNKVPSYDEALDETRNVFKQAKEDNPLSYTGSEIAGSIAPFVAGGGLAAGAVKGTGTAANIGRGAIAGAAPSAVQGFNSGEGFGDRVGGGVASAILGGTVGAAFPAIGAGVTSIRNRPFKDPVVSVVDDILSKSGQGKDKSLRSAMQQVARARADDAIDAVDLDRALLEQGGEATKSIAMGAGRKGGEGGRIIGQYAEEAMAPETIARKAGDVVSKHLDDPGLALTEGLDDFAKIVREKAKPAYKEAYDAVPDIAYKKVSNVLSRLDDNELKNVFDYAGKMARREGRTIGVKGEDGAIKSLSTEALDYISRAIRDPAAFGDKPLGKGLISFNNEISRDLRNVLKQENPAWAKAVGEYSDAIGLQDAAELGRMFSPSGSAKKLSDVVASFKKMNANEREAFRMGFGENIFGQINKNPSAFLRQVRSPQYVTALKEVMPADQVDDIVRQAEGQFQTLGRVRDVSKNSVTSNAMAAMGNQAREEAIANAAEGAASGNIAGLMRSVLGNKARTVTEKFLGSPETAALIARGVTTAPKDLAATPQGRALLEAILAKPVKKTVPPSIIEKILAKPAASSGTTGAAITAVREN